MFFSKKRQNIRKSRKKKEIALKSLLYNFSPATRYAEAYRTLRTNLHFAMKDKELTCLVITSSVQSEGKTNTAVNLGYSIAETGKKVLLVDCDLRKPMMTDIFELKKEGGMVNLLTDVLDTNIDKGDLSEYTISDLIQIIKYQKRTGVLNIISTEDPVSLEKDRISLYFIHGNVYDLLWHNRPDNKKIVSILLEKKLITSQEDVQLGVETKKKTGRRLGAIFHSMGLVSKEDIQKVLSLQVLDAIRLASTINEGEFEFVQTPERDIRSSISPQLEFEEIFKEFFGHGDQQSYISRSIDAFVHPTDKENLFVIASGKPPSNPAELIASERTPFIIESLKQKFDFIIIDTPPVLPATGSMLIAPHTDGTMLVVRSGHANKKIVKDVVDRYHNANLNLLGILLNRVNMKKEGYYYRYYQKYYSSYYGES